MKKTYKKPEIMFEDFSLSSSISAGCELDTPQPSYEQTCGYPFKGGVAFLESMVGICNAYPSDDGKWNGFCYHVPTDYSNLFNS